MRLIIASIMLLMSVQAKATIIIDTGSPFISGPPSSGGFVLNINQSLAAEFTLDQAYILTDLEGFIGGEVAGTAAITIYTDDGEIPGSDLFSGGVSLGLGDAWQGLSGQNISLDAGTYWISFELRGGDTFTGRMLGGAPSPLGNEAFTTKGYIPLNLQGGSSWVENDGLNIGVRIQGDLINTIPEPTSLILMGIGLLGLGLSRRKRFQ